ncbi:hypothetical protein N0V94_003874 [Neodidymelliopsis sp. IMI 364377]|nr:hypothetical protein N0V94_003874 [Neodidymelliopsis sp. IMI 364377]
MSASSELEARTPSWIHSPLRGRFAGGVYCTALRLAWEKEMDAAETAQDITAVSRERKSSNSNEEIYDTLFRIEDEVDEYDVGFLAQDNDWNSLQVERTGSSLIACHQGWESCETHTSTGRFSRRFANASAAREHVLAIATRYMRSFPGPDNAANNGPLHNLISSLQDNTYVLTEENLNAIYHPVRFRLLLAQQATWLLAAAGIALPNGLPCNRWNESDFRKHMRQSPGNVVDKKYEMAVEKVFASILPKPYHPRQGFAWVKPHRYIAAAVACDDRVDSPAKVGEAIARLREVAAEELARVKEDVESYGAIRDMKRDVFSKVE